MSLAISSHILQEINYLPNQNYHMATFQWSNDPNPLTITPQVIVPDENKPNLFNISSLDSIPIIDMNTDTEALIHEISRACEEYGFFQLINHGISLDLCHSVLDVITSLFEQPYEVKAHMISTKQTEDGKIFRYYINDEETNEKLLMWGEALFHSWHPFDDSYLQNLPTNPPCYREIIAAYIEDTAALITQLLSLLSKALGLEKGYLQRSLGQNPKRTAQANYYPPCPNPNLTLGLRDHTDINILTVLLPEEGVPGLQVLKADKWFTVDPVPGALIINVADQLQVLSNDKFKSVRHRVVTNETAKRASFAIFVGPQEDVIINPIEGLIEEDKPSLYRSYTFGEFMQEFQKQEGRTRMVKEVFKIVSHGSK